MTKIADIAFHVVNLTDEWFRNAAINIIQTMTFC